MSVAQKRSSRSEKINHFMIQWLIPWQHCLVYARVGAGRKVNLQQIGEFTSNAELQAGRIFPLADGSSLQIQLQGPALVASRNGVLLPPIQAPAVELVDAKTLNAANTAAGVVIAVAVLTVFAGLIGLIPALGGSIAGGLITLIIGFILIILAIYVYRHSQIALIIACTLYALDTLLQILSLASGATNAAGGVVIHILFLFFLLRGIRPMNSIQKAKRENQATNHITCYQAQAAAQK